MMVSRMLRGLLITILVVSGLVNQVISAAETYSLVEPAADTRVRLVEARVSTGGKVLTSAGGEKTTELKLDAAAAFRFRERRLPPAGRDSEALRAVRDIELATMQTQVGDHPTQVQLPDHLRLIVANGRREGVAHYCPTAPLTRDALDLLELPGDSLALTALLPPQPVEVGGEWKPGEWVIQMLGTIEAVETTDLVCKLASVSGGDAHIDFRGRIKGQRWGANSELTITGKLIYDLRQKLIREAKAVYKVVAAVGTVSPGLEATVDVTVERQLAAGAGRLTDALAESIPLDPPAAALELSLDAAPWGIRMRLDRNWLIYQAQYDRTPQLVILRLMEQGSLVAQCNMSPVPPVASGQHTPLEHFEADIERALGDRFKGVLARNRIPTEDGKILLRVDTDGEFIVKGNKGGAAIPMNWIYYLVADKSGRQVSFVFAVEPSLRERLGDRDLEMVKSLQFTGR